jgi:hypothetical protein
MHTPDILNYGKLYKASDNVDDSDFHPFKYHISGKQICR